MSAKVKCIALWAVVLLACSMTAVAQTTEDLLAIRAAFAKAIDAHDLDAIVSYFADDGVFCVTYLPEPLDTKEKIKAYFADIYLGSPDTHTTEGLILSSGNTVVVDHAMVGTHTHDQPGIPATGKSWVGPHLDVYDFEGGKIQKLITYADITGYLIQIGLMPTPPMLPLVPSVVVPAAEATGFSPLEANAELVRRCNSHDVAHIAKMIREDASHFAGPLGRSLDRVEMAALNEMYFQGFPNTTIKPLRTLDLGGGWVLLEYVVTGTQDGPFMGVPASGYLAEIPVAWLAHYDAAGLLTQQSFYYDNLTLMTQITTAEWSLDGVWVAAVPTPLGMVVLKCVYTAQDAGKTRFGGVLEYINGLPLFTELYPDEEQAKFAGGQVAKVGRNKYEVTFLEYRTNTIGPAHVEIVGMDFVAGSFEIVGPDLIRGQGTGSYYMAVQDADHDGFPDEGQKPVLCIPWQWTARRLTATPGCVPTPMP